MTIHAAYKNTYWAAFKSSAPAKAQHIVEARNQIAQCMNLRPWKAPRTWFSSPVWDKLQSYDHLEFYRFKNNGACIMFHDYDMSQETRKRHLEHGWQRLVCLYSDSTDSWQINAQTPRHLLSLFKRLHGLEDMPVMLPVSEPLGYDDYSMFENDADGV